MNKKPVRKANDRGVFCSKTSYSQHKSIASVARYMHGTIARHCDNCGRAMTPSDVNDFGSLCERCYTKEYYD